MAQTYIHQHGGRTYAGKAGPVTYPETSYGNPSVLPLYRSTQIIRYAFYVVETILAFRFLLKLLGASTAAGFTQFVYNISSPFVAPFLYVVPSPQVASSTIEWTTLLAMFTYWVLAWGIIRLIVMSKPVSREEANYKLRKQDVVEE